MSQSPTDLELTLDATAPSSAENSAKTPSSDSSQQPRLPAQRQSQPIKPSSNASAPAAYFALYVLN